MFLEIIGLQIPSSMLTHVCSKCLLTIVPTSHRFWRNHSEQDERPALMECRETKLINMQTSEWEIQIITSTMKKIVDRELSVVIFN